MPKLELQIQIGKITRGYNSDQTWVYYLTPTKFEKPLRQAPVQLIRKRTEKVDERNVLYFSEYEILSAFDVRMVYIHTSFGKPTRVIRIDVKLNPKAAKIEIKTQTGFLRARAEVMGVDGDISPETRDALIKIIEPPKESRSNRRKLGLIK